MVVTVAIKILLDLYRGCLWRTIYSRYTWLALLAQLQIFFSQIFFLKQNFWHEIFFEFENFRKLSKIFEKNKNLKIFEKIKNLKIFEIFEKIKKNWKKNLVWKKISPKKNIHPLPKCSYQPKRFWNRPSSLGGHASQTDRQTSEFIIKIWRFICFGTIFSISVLT